MIECEVPFPPGQIMIVSPDLARFTEFNQCLLKLQVPRGTSWQWPSGTSIEANRNVAISKLTAASHWVYTIDDDHTFKPDTLLRLLYRMMNDDRIDILQGLCFTRKPPYLPYAYIKDPNYKDLGIGYINAQWSDLPTEGISEWDAVGTGGMLIRRTVFDKMAYPWFESGKTFKDQIGEDLYFCTKAKELGFRVWVDSDVRTGHMHIHSVWPVVKNGEWHAGLDLGQDVRIALDRSSWANARFDEIRVPIKKGFAQRKAPAQQKTAIPPFAQRETGPDE